MLENLSAYTDLSQHPQAKVEEPDHPLGAFDLRGSSVEEIVTEVSAMSHNNNHN